MTKVFQITYRDHLDLRDLFKSSCEHQVDRVAVGPKAPIKVRDVAQAISETDGDGVHFGFVLKAGKLVQVEVISASECHQHLLNYFSVKHNKDETNVLDFTTLMKQVERLHEKSVLQLNGEEVPIDFESAQQLLILFNASQEQHQAYLVHHILQQLENQYSGEIRVDFEAFLELISDHEKGLSTKATFELFDQFFTEDKYGPEVNKFWTYLLNHLIKHQLIHPDINDPYLNSAEFFTHPQMKRLLTAHTPDRQIPLCSSFLRCLQPEGVSRFFWDSKGVSLIGTLAKFTTARPLKDHLGEAIRGLFASIGEHILPDLEELSLKDIELLSAKLNCIQGFHSQLPIVKATVTEVTSKLLKPLFEKIKNKLQQGLALSEEELLSLGGLLAQVKLFRLTFSREEIELLKDYFFLNIAISHFQGQTVFDYHSQIRLQALLNVNLLHSIQMRLPGQPKPVGPSFESHKLHVAAVLYQNLFYQSKAVIESREVLIRDTLSTYVKGASHFDLAPALKGLVESVQNPYMISRFLQEIIFPDMKRRIVSLTQDMHKVFTDLDVTTTKSLTLKTFYLKAFDRFEALKVVPHPALLLTLSPNLQLAWFQSGVLDPILGLNLKTDPLLHTYIPIVPYEDVQVCSDAEFREFLDEKAEYSDSLLQNLELVWNKDLEPSNAVHQIMMRKIISKLIELNKSGDLSDELLRVFFTNIQHEHQVCWPGLCQKAEKEYRGACLALKGAGAPHFTALTTGRHLAIRAKVQSTAFRASVSTFFKDVLNFDDGPRALIENHLFQSDIIGNRDLIEQVQDLILTLIDLYNEGELTSEQVQELFTECEEDLIGFLDRHDDFIVEQEFKFLLAICEETDKIGSKYKYGTVKFTLEDVKEKLLKPLELGLLKEKSKELGHLLIRLLSSPFQEFNSMANNAMEALVNLLNRIKEDSTPQELTRISSHIETILDLTLAHFKEIISEMNEVGAEELMEFYTTAQEELEELTQSIQEKRLGSRLSKEGLKAKVIDPARAYITEADLEMYEKHEVHLTAFKTEIKEKAKLLLQNTDEERKKAAIEELHAGLKEYQKGLEEEVSKPELKPDQVTTLAEKYFAVQVVTEEGGQRFEATVGREFQVRLLQIIQSKPDGISVDELLDSLKLSKTILKNRKAKELARPRDASEKLLKEHILKGLMESDFILEKDGVFKLNTKRAEVQTYTQEVEAILTGEDASSSEVPSLAELRGALDYALELALSEVAAVKEADYHDRKVALLPILIGATAEFFERYIDQNPDSIRYEMIKVMVPRDTLENIEAYHATATLKETIQYIYANLATLIPDGEDGEVRETITRIIWSGNQVHFLSAVKRAYANHFGFDPEIAKTDEHVDQYLELPALYGCQASLLHALEAPKAELKQSLIGYLENKLNSTAASGSESIEHFQTFYEAIQRKVTEFSRNDDEAQILMESCFTPEKLEIIEDGIVTQRALKPRLTFFGVNFLMQEVGLFNLNVPDASSKSPVQFNRDRSVSPLSETEGKGPTEEEKAEDEEMFEKSHLAVAREAQEVKRYGGGGWGRGERR